MIRIYARISRDEDGNSYTSIENQIEIAKSYIKENKFPDETKVYTDDDISGYTFDRPGFNRLIKEAEPGDIVIVKDLSRLGRNNPHTLLCLEEFASKNIRLIAINDNYDSFKDDDDIVGIKTWFNERYVKDISKKIKKVFMMKKEKGEVIGRRHVPYGYTLNEKREIVIFEEEAKVVRKIFEMYIQGKGIKAIAYWLNVNHIPTPFAKYGSKKTLWDFSTVRFILLNDVYTGVWRSNTTYRNKIRGKRALKQDDDKVFVFENHHPAIIDKETFYYVQELYKKRSKYRHKKIIHTFSGIIYCGECGHVFYACRKLKNSIHYVCGNYHRYGNLVCVCNLVNEAKLMKHILDNLREFLYHKRDEIETKVKERCFQDKDHINSEIKRIESLISKNNKKMELLYSDRLNEIITLEMFNSLKEKIVEENKQLQDRINMLRDEDSLADKIKENYLDIKTLITKFSNAMTLERADIEKLIDKIVVYKSGKIDIYWKGIFQ